MSRPAVSITFNRNRSPLHKSAKLVPLCFMRDKFTVNKYLCIKFTMLKLKLIAIGDKITSFYGQQ